MLYNVGMKNKKGFTLVELIVVIAIMAVLAGTVAGATVGIMNKKTDEVNYIYNGRQIAVQIAEWAREVYDNPAYFFELTGATPKFDLSAISGATADDITSLWDDSYADAAYATLKNRFSTLNWKDTYGTPDKKGQFSADFNDGAVFLYYRGKSRDYAQAYYKIYMSDSGSIATDKGNGFPT